MERIHDAVEEGRDVVFEGACGTGKTLSALVPSLEHARREDRTVVITTNVHQQMRQFVEEAREIKELEDISVAVFRGKSSMCHIDVGYEECEALRDNTFDLVDLEDERDELAKGDQTSDDVEARETLRDNTYDLVELEDELDELRQEAASGSGVEPDVEERIEAIESTVEEMHENGRVCDHFHSNVTESNESFFDWLDSGVRSPDEVYDRADSVGKCGYELLKEGMESVDVVICNYHHLLSPEIRDYF
ncbi:MAG: ATP-dependent DNA helicase, partial [Halobacteria archaeon]|nr:ATP-dependent DNA helicase [Halobacteria archaeon]